MSGGAVARRYARAVFDIASDQGELDRWRNDLSRIAMTLGDPLMSQATENPKADLAQKQDLLRRVLDGINPLALNLVFLLVAKDRIDIADGIAAEYERLYNQQQGVEVARVTTAVALSPEEERAMAQQLGTMTGKQIVLETNVDPS